MKFLLTSSGIKNNSIAQTIIELVGTEREKIRAIYIPTAANVELGDKGWLIDDLHDFQMQDYESVDIIDIAAVPREVWQPRLESANLICFGGGNEQFLARVMRESGFAAIAKDILKERVYMGISAGSMVAGTFLPKEVLEIVYPEQTFQKVLEQPLGLVDCSFIPHFNSPWFPKIKKEVIDALPGTTSPLYVLDDQSALKIVDGKIEVVSEGTYIQHNS